MACIAISFIPWIVYWVLSGLRNPLGVVLAFAISLALLAWEVKSRRVNFMDVTSLIYFTVALVGTYAFDLKLFVEESGFLGYMVLFIMAACSIAARNPFTFQVSKRDYPEVYWRDRMFIFINNVIAIAWALIFLVNAVMLFFELPYAKAITITLVVAGIIFSAAFPLKAPAYLATREFRRYDWKVEVDAGEPKEEDEYDVIIVGSGIGGLTCGALLSKRGYKVLVLEQHHQVGGYCTSFRRGGFVFNSGVEDVSGLWDKGPITYLLKELGLSREELFVRNKVRYIFKGELIDMPDNLDELVKKLSQMFPSEEESIRAFFDEAKRAYEECYREADVYGAPLPAWLIPKVFGDDKLRNYPKEHPHFYDWINKTYKEKLDEHFKDEDLKSFLCALLGYLGTKPEKTSASSALTACLSYYMYGGYYPKGGAQNFAEALRRVIESCGGRVLVRHRVDKIIVEDGRVKGVRVGGKVFRSTIVVSNANAKTTFLELVGEEHLDRGFVEYIRGLKMSPSCFMVFLGLDMDLSEYPTLIKDLDEGCDVVVNSNADSSLAPRGGASVTILMGANYEFPERGTEEYLRKKMEMTEMLIRKAERAIPGLSSHIVICDAATPKTFERYTSMPEGAIYAFDQSIGTKRPYFKTPIKGLYLVGASTFPGGGVEAVVISGIICANDICGWRIKAV